MCACVYDLFFRRAGYKIRRLLSIRLLCRRFCRLCRLCRRLCCNCRSISLFVRWSSFLRLILLVGTEKWLRYLKTLSASCRRLSVVAAGSVPFPLVRRFSVAFMTDDGRTVSENPHIGGRHVLKWKRNLCSTLGYEVLSFPSFLPTARTQQKHKTIHRHMKNQLDYY